MKHWTDKSTAASSAAPVKLVSVSGSWQSPSKTRALTDAVAVAVGDRRPVELTTIDLAEVGQAIVSLRDIKAAEPEIRLLFSAVEQSDLLIVGSPIFKASYTGIFKHFFDLFDPHALIGKPVLLTATGGTHHHALVLEHHIRPLFAFFRARTLPTTIYAIADDFEDGVLINGAVKDRIEQAADEAAHAIELSTFRRAGVRA
ncbi:NAD(P)H-dependent oxidoreductase [Hyphomicrobium sp.]|uniref:NAD(P)H-dependent oxidoreductase n=1 Tax=Hyphomicrobium sp. TaxID=82 RepID=UPI001DC26C3E|nr:NAD(P)H-dependent oxidoreductase [Hyphomicrobium sp.]MBY0558531.1 NAD(P)H-dependent oxidoreductase [Hyphomicrobium sp.]